MVENVAVCPASAVIFAGAEVASAVLTVKVAAVLVTEVGVVAESVTTTR